VNDYPITVEQLPMNARVLHPTFGRGTITGHGKSEDSGEDVILVAFDDLGEKRLVPRFAKLSLLCDSESIQLRAYPAGADIPTSANAVANGRPASLEEKFLQFVEGWRLSVENMVECGTDEDECSYDLWERDLLLKLIEQHPALAGLPEIELLASIDRRYFFIRKHHPAGSGPPAPADIAAGRWWRDLLPKAPKPRGKHYRQWKGDAYNLVMMFSASGEVIAEQAREMRVHAYVDFIMELVYPPQLWRRHRSHISHCSDFLRACTRRHGQNLTHAGIAMRIDPNLGVLYTVQLGIDSGPRIRGTLRNVKAFTFEWLDE